MESQLWTLFLSQFSARVCLRERERERERDVFKLRLRARHHTKVIENQIERERERVDKRLSALLQKTQCILSNYRAHHIDIHTIIPPHKVLGKICHLTGREKMKEDNAEAFEKGSRRMKSRKKNLFSFSNCWNGGRALLTYMAK
jgi:hypothetical protein